MNTSRFPSACTFFISFVLVLGTVTAPAQIDQYPHCQIVDRIAGPIWEVQFGYVSREEVRKKGADEFGLTEFRASSGLAYFQTPAGSLDLRASLEGWIPSGSGGVDLPDQFGSVALNLEWTQRYPNGFSLRLGADPGLYSDFEDLSGHDVFVPLRVAAIQALSPQVSGLAGLRIFPGFDRIVDPLIGLRWAPNDALLVDVFYPESRLVFAPSEALEVYAGFLNREALEFQLEEDDERDRFRYDERRLYAGVNYAYSDLVRYMLQVGTVFDRRIDFDSHGRGGAVDSGLFVRVGVGGVL